LRVLGYVRDSNLPPGFKQELEMDTLLETEENQKTESKNKSDRFLFFEIKF